MNALPVFSANGARLSLPALDNHGDNFGVPVYGRAKCLICKENPCIDEN